MGRTAEKRPKKRPPWLVPARATGWRECRRSRRRSCRPLTRAEKRGAREREREGVGCENNRSTRR